MGIYTPEFLETENEKPTTLQLIGSKEVVSISKESQLPSLISLKNTTTSSSFIKVE